MTYREPHSSTIGCGHGNIGLNWVDHYHVPSHIYLISRLSVGASKLEVQPFFIFGDG